ncbi:hypothetical protein Tco_1367360 [Tanacetum coccineum]
MICDDGVLFFNDMITYNVSSVDAIDSLSLVEGSLFQLRCGLTILILQCGKGFAFSRVSTFKTGLLIQYAVPYAKFDEMCFVYDLGGFLNKYRPVVSFGNAEEAVCCLARLPVWYAAVIDLHPKLLSGPNTTEALYCVVCFLHGVFMNRGFLNSGGRKNNHRKETDTVTGTGSVMESNKTLNFATPLADSVEKEVMSPSVDETVAKDKQTPTSLGSAPPLPTHETPSAGNAPGGNGIDVVVSVDSIKAISERFANKACGFFLGKQKWHLDVNLLKEDVSTVPVWVKLDGVPVTTSSYARPMNKLRADVELKDNIMATMPKITREGYYTCNILVEYEWKSPRCACCKVFGHDQEECPKNIGNGEMKNLKKTSQTSKGIPVGQKVGIKPKQVYQSVSKKPTASTSVNKKKNVEPVQRIENKAKTVPDIH